MKDSEVEALNFDGWPLPDDYLIEIGRVMALWSSLEGLLNLCLGKLAGFNDILGALCEHLAPDFPNIAGYKTTISTLRIAQRERNKFAHGGIGPSENPGAIVIAQGSARGSLKTNVQKITVADIRRAVIAIHEAQTSLYKLVLGRDLPAAWQR